MTKPRIAITLGDPAGIGPEIAAKAARDPRVRQICEPVFYGAIDIRHFPEGVSAEAGRSACDAIVEAVGDALSGRVDAVATAPISKEAFALAGLPWRGHTELLAHLTGAPSVAMMFHAEALRVVLATITSRWPMCRACSRAPGSSASWAWPPASCRASASRGRGWRCAG